MGFGEPTGIDLPTEIGGVVPDQNWARTTISRTLYDGEVLQSALGQGYDLATPLQVMNSFAALANGGTLWQPHVVLELRNPDGTLAQTIEPVEREALECALQPWRRCVVLRDLWWRTR